MSHTHSTLSRWLAEGHGRRPPPTLAGLQDCEEDMEQFFTLCRIPHQLKGHLLTLFPVSGTI